MSALRSISSKADRQAFAPAARAAIALVAVGLILPAACRPLRAPEDTLEPEDGQEATALELDADEEGKKFYPGEELQPFHLSGMDDDGIYLLTVDWPDDGSIDFELRAMEGHGGEEIRSADYRGPEREKYHILFEKPVDEKARFFCGHGWGAPDRRSPASVTLSYYGDFSDTGVPDADDPLTLSPGEDEGVAGNLVSLVHEPHYFRVVDLEPETM